MDRFTPWGSLHYGDKHELFLSSLKHYDEVMRRAFSAELERRFTPLKAIQGLFQAFVDQVAVQGQNRGCFLTNTALELAAHDSEAAAIVANARPGSKPSSPA